MSQDEPWIVIEVDEECEAERLDAWLARRLEGSSRRAVVRLIEDGAVTVDGRRCRKGDLVRPGAAVEIWRSPAPGRWTPAAALHIALTVLYEDPLLLVVDKPAGIASVPHAPEDTETLAGAVVARFPECREVGRRNGDGGLLQRLDGPTSGLVLVARNQVAFDQLLEAQRRGRVEKSYLALVTDSGSPLPKTVDRPLAPWGPGGRWMRVDPEGRAAVTRLRVVEELPGALLVEAVIHNGLRHQIRAHLASIGHPLVGDELYEGPSLLEVTRLFLHAHAIRFVHPQTGSPLEVRSPLPPELAEAVTRGSRT